VQTPDREAEVLARIAPLMPVGERATHVALACRIPAGATLKSTAAGMVRLETRGFIVEFQDGDRTIACSATLEAERTVLAAARDIAPGEAVSAADFAPHPVDAYSIAPGSLTSFPDAGSYVAASPIRTGQPLYASNLARPVAVHAGDLVSVTVRNGPVTIRTQLQANSNAAVGETATMVNPGTGAPIAATVTGPRSAEMSLQ